MILVASLAVRGVPEDSEDDSKLEPPELLEAEEMPSWEYVGAAAGGSSFFLYRLDDDHIHLVMILPQLKFIYLYQHVDLYIYV